MPSKDSPYSWPETTDGICELKISANTIAVRAAESAGDRAPTVLDEIGHRRVGRQLLDGRIDERRNAGCGATPTGDGAVFGIHDGLRLLVEAAADQ